MNKQLNQELFDHNIAQRSIKDASLNAEKRADKQMIDNNVERERMLDYLEKEYKVRSLSNILIFLFLNILKNM